MAAIVAAAMIGACALVYQPGECAGHFAMTLTVGNHVVVSVL